MRAANVGTRNRECLTLASKSIIALEMPKLKEMHRVRKLIDA
jgi:hypothetical protein